MSSNSLRAIACSIGVLLENQFNHVIECDEEGLACDLCTSRGREVLSISHELDELDYLGVDYSLPRLPEIGVDVYGMRISALIDTGSQISAITRELHDSIRKERGDLPEIAIPAIQVQGAFGSRSESANRMVLIELSLGGTIIETSMLILHRLPRSMILGYDWLEHVKGIVECGRERTLSIEHLGVRTSVKINSSCELKRLGGRDNANMINTMLETDAQPAVYNEASEKINNSGKVATYLDEMGLNDEQKKLLLPVLNRYSRVFTDELGLTDRYEHVIELIDDTPFIKRSYPIPLAYREEIKRELDGLEGLGVIRQEATPCCSPLTFTKKRDGTIRLLLDARELNKKMVGDAGAPPLTSEIIQSFYGVNYISLIDLNNAYFQIPLHPDSRKYTGFTFMGKTYTYCVLPQGLKTSVAGFSRAMDSILEGVREFCINYIDDIVVFTKGDLKLHLEHLDQVLSRLEAARLTSRKEKCKFLCVEVKLLGHIVNTKGVQMDPDRVRAILDFPAPRTIKQLRGFLGLINYFRRFVSKYSEEVRPLCDLLKQNKRWSWTQEVDGCFKRVKTLFVDTVLLAHPNPKDIYYLQTDSSNIGVAGYIYQLTSEGEERVIGFCSKSLSETERRWTVTEQELWAIIYSLSKFETYLRGARLVIRTDHKSLTFLQSCKLLSARMIRWVSYIGQFNYTIEHVKGSLNTVADVLSRHISGVTDILTNKTVGPEMNLFEIPTGRLIKNNWEEIREHQGRDRVVSEITKRIKVGSESEARHYRLIDGILYRIEIGSGRSRLYVPENLQTELITSIHEEVGHFGRYKVLALMKRRYYFTEMARKIGQVVRACDVCQKSKHALETHSGPIKTVIAREIGERVFCDIYGPIPAGRFGHKYVFVMQDAFSKLIRLYSLRQASGRASLTCVRKFHEQVKIKVLCSDRGANFTSRIFESGVRQLGIVLTHTSIRNPRPNSTERVNRELGRMFRTYCEKSHCSWVDVLPKIEDCYNQVIHTTTGYTPNEIVWGTGTRLSTDNDKIIGGGLGLQQEPLELVRERARQNMLKSAESREFHYNKNHKLVCFDIGDLVKLKKFAKSDASKKVTKKFARLFEGPYVIGAIPSSNVYTLIDKQTNKIKGNYNAIHLFRYYVNR